MSTIGHSNPLCQRFIEEMPLREIRHRACLTLIDSCGLRLGYLILKTPTAFRLTARGWRSAYPGKWGRRFINPEWVAAYRASYARSRNPFRVGASFHATPG